MGLSARKLARCDRDRNGDGFGLLYSPPLCDRDRKGGLTPIQS